MTESEFSSVVGECINNIYGVLDDKGFDYSRGGDRLHNFKRAAKVGETTPGKALLGMKLKHDVSILDIVDDLEYGNLPSVEKLDEKFGDAINYLILLKAVVMEAINDAKLHS
jgi:hypothetical protein